MAVLELQILDWIQLLRNPVLDQIMLFITKCSDGGMLWIGLAAIFCLKKNTRKTGIMLICALLLEILLCNGILKPMIGRIRPCGVVQHIQLLIDMPLDPSFPSGHTGASFASTAILFLRKDSLRYPALIIALLTAFSRMYLYVHYPTDILGGMVAGILCGMVSNMFYIHLTKTYKNHFVF